MGMAWTLSVAVVSFGGYQLCAESLLRAAVLRVIFPPPPVFGPGQKLTAFRLSMLPSAHHTAEGTVLGNWSLGGQLLWRLQGASQRPMKILVPVPGCLCV